ncbi:hypothetical protein PR048_016746, partial [Dryococelus australis]
MKILRTVKERAISPPRLTVWCGTSARGHGAILPPYIAADKPLCHMFTDSTQMTMAFSRRKFERHVAMTCMKHLFGSHDLRGMAGAKRGSGLFPRQRSKTPEGASTSGCRAARSSCHGCAARRDRNEPDAASGLMIKVETVLIRFSQEGSLNAFCYLTATKDLPPLATSKRAKRKNEEERVGKVEGPAVSWGRGGGVSELDKGAQEGRSNSRVWEVRGYASGGCEELNLSDWTAAKQETSVCGTVSAAGPLTHNSPPPLLPSPFDPCPTPLPTSRRTGRKLGVQFGLVPEWSSCAKRSRHTHAINKFRPHETTGCGGPLEAKGKEVEAMFTFVLGGGRFSCRPVGANASAAQPLAVHRSDGALRFLQQHVRMARSTNELSVSSLSTLYTHISTTPDKHVHTDLFLFPQQLRVAEWLACSPPILYEPGSIPGRFTPGFSHVGIVSDDGTGWWVFSEISPFLHPFIYSLSSYERTLVSVKRINRFLYSAKYVWNKVLIHNNGSTWRPLTSLHTWYLRMMFRYTSSITPGAPSICCAATITRASRYSSVSLYRSLLHHTLSSYDPTRHSRMEFSPAFPSVEREDRSSNCPDPAYREATVAKRLTSSPPTKAGSPDFLMWESCRTMSLVGGFSRGSPISPASYPYSPQSSSSALKTSLLRAAQISSLTHPSLRMM